MVRKASRLAPGKQSVEEVLLNRLANGEAAGASTAGGGGGGSGDTPASTARSSSALPANPMARRAHALKSAKLAKTAGATIRPKPSADSLKSGPPASTAPAATGAASSDYTAFSRETMSMAAMQLMATEISSLDQRLQRLASDSSHSPSGVSTKRTTLENPPSHERSAHQLGIEHYLQDSMREISSGHRARSDRSDASTPSSPAVNPRAGAYVTHSVRELRSTVRRLDKVFYEVASGDKQRHIAATKISMLCRGFVVRRRFQKLQSALGSWRARKCSLFLMFMEQFAAREEFINKQIVLMHEHRISALLRRVLAEIRDVVLMNSPLRLSRLEETERRFHQKQCTLLQLVFVPWKTTALGPRSRKKASMDSRARHSAARQRLEAMERFDVITKEMVHEEFLKDNIRRIRSRHTTHVLRMYFRILLRVVLEPMKLHQQIAERHARRTALRRVLDAWLPLFRAAQIDKAIASVTERRSLERFDQHYNLRKIDAHYKRTNLLKHLRAWAKYGQLIRRVRRLFEGSTRETLTWLTRRWHVHAQYQRALRANAVEEWQAYSRRIFQIPFRRWYVHMAHKRASRAAKESICVAYERRQRRHTKYNFFRLWKHQVLFGHVEGLHSKVHLLRSLEDQKRMCLGLEANAALYRDNIAALEASIAQLEDKLCEKQQELAQLHETTQVTRFGIHRAEQSIARVQGMLEAVRLVHPGTVERVESMYRDNPLLSKDLKDVLTLHAAKRRELLAQIELDETELEVQTASAVGVASREDQLLLHRVKWVLSRMDLGMTEQATRQQDAATLGRASRAATLETLGQLCALFEFIRDGNTQALTPENSPEHQVLGSSSTASGSGGGNNAVEERIVRRGDLVTGSGTWHAFLQALAIKFVPEKMLSVKERLVRRAADMDADIARIKAAPQLHHLYR